MNEVEERLTQVRAYAIQCIKEETDATLNLINLLDENFDKAVSLMFHCRGKVIVTGVGKSGNIGAKIAATLSSTGTPAFFASCQQCYCVVMRKVYLLLSKLVNNQRVGSDDGVVRLFCC